MLGRHPVKQGESVCKKQMLLVLCFFFFFFFFFFFLPTVILLYLFILYVRFCNLNITANKRIYIY